MDRKAAIRAYKEGWRPMGVYRVRNIVTGKSLVAASTDLPAIFNRHRAQLRIGSHPDRGLQKDWNELGQEAFEFEVLDTLTPPDEPGYDPSGDLRVLEQLWIAKLSLVEAQAYSTKPKRAT
ncbi:MAG: GIY-YIG nuclease family protein [Candidatus Hydrogenedentes bacterium]|nr:GIY-YIG nuclease family protein [Candidatus Hydrogenedentota bacterium]